MNDNDQEFDETVEIRDLPQGQMLSSREHLLACIPSSIFPLLFWMRQHRRISVLGTASFVIIALVIFVMSLLPLQQLRAGKGLGPPPPLSGPDLFYHWVAQHHGKQK